MKTDRKKATQSGNDGTLVNPGRSCSWWDAVNCGHKDTYANALTYRSWRCLAEMEGQLERTAKQALEFLNKAPLQGRKDIWQVLEMVMADADIATVYLLSSGEPDVGLYVHWNRITMHLKDLNRFRKVVIHTIAYSDSKWFRDQLEKIAEATGGEFTWFD